MTSLTLQQWLQRAAQQLEQLLAIDPHVVDVRMEARRLAGDLLDISPTGMQLKMLDVLTVNELQRLDAALVRRCQGEPLAYITGRWWFWDLELEVAPCTLIPRPDTELLVEQALELTMPLLMRVLDLGTGTGAIALSLAKARPQWQVTAVDYSEDAVALALRNCQRLGLNNCSVQQSDWFSKLAGQKFQLIVSNPPYIDAADQNLQQGDVRFEPRSALVAPANGLADLAVICQQAPEYLDENGWIWLEHGYQQAEAVQDLLRQAGFSLVQSRRDYAGQWRITGGCWQH